MTYRECLQEAEKRLREAGIEEAASDSWLLFSWVFQMSRASYYMDMNRACPPFIYQRIYQYCRKKHEKIREDLRRYPENKET